MATRDNIYYTNFSTLSRAVILGLIKVTQRFSGVIPRDRFDEWSRQVSANMLVYHRKIPSHKYVECIDLPAARLYVLRDFR